MPISIKMTIRRWLGVLLVGLAGLTGGAWITLKVTIDDLLYREATSAATGWAEYLAANVTDLQQIAAGERPSAATMMVFRAAREAGQVFRYIIFNRDGYSQLIADQNGIALVGLSEPSIEATQAIKSGEPYVVFGQAQSADLPPYFAAAYVFARVGRQPVAIVAAYVDQTEQRRVFYEAFLASGTAVCLLTGFGFGVPAIAWYRRTQEKQQADRRIRFLAQHDPMTGLINRAQFKEVLENAFATTSPPSRATVYFVDVDHFQSVNDAVGHTGGDFVLKTIAERLRSVTRAEDVAARLGGDEFAVLQTGVAGKHAAESFARRISAALTAPAQFNAQQIETTISVGIAVSPEDGDTAERLLKSADLAMHGAKAAGRNCVRFFSADMDELLQARMELERTIRRAVQHDQFKLHYQPMFEIATKRLVGFEALLRLPAPGGTLIPPGTFIPVTEEMNLIGKVGALALRDACRTAAGWPEPLIVAVNLSPAQFEAGAISEMVAAALAESGVPARRLELEITENLLLGDNDHIMAELKKLKSMGAAIVMDDFGSGFSSLRYLWQFPFDKIKIDRSFMQGFAENRASVETVVRSIIALARELHMRVIVEGVETTDQADFLNGSGADQVQGFLFGKPVPADEIAADLLTEVQQRPSRTATTAGLR